MKKLYGMIIGSGLVLASGQGNFAYSFELSGVTRMQRPNAEALFLQEKARAMEPFAHILFCMKSPEECRASSQAGVIDFTEENRRSIIQVNKRVNHSIIAQADNGFGEGLDEWTVSPTHGDCDDYAITKRHELIRNGFPASALRLASARTRSGEGHLVLIVRTNEGDMVLDNLTDAVRSWKKTSLTWQQIQSASDPRVWYRL